MTDFRTAILGRITLETPEDFEAWRAAGALRDIERDAKNRPARIARRKAAASGSPEWRSRDAASAALGAFVTGTFFMETPLHDTQPARL